MIRPWKSHDRAQIEDIILKFIRDQQKYGGDLAATPKNIDWFWAMGMTFAANEEPTFVIEERGKILAATMAGPILSDFELRWKTLQMYLLYVLPSQRGVTHSIELLRAVGKRMVERGYERATSLAFLQNRKIFEIVFTGDTWPTQVVIEWRTSLFDSGKEKTKRLDI